MSLETEVLNLFQHPTDIHVECKAILPPSQTLAQYIAAFANTDGGYLILGVIHTGGHLQIQGITSDFNASPITQKAISLLSFRPEIEYGYVTHGGKQLFVIKVGKSPSKISVDGKEYQFINRKISEINPEIFSLKPDAYARIKQLSEDITINKQNVTPAGMALFNHYLGILKIIDNLRPILFPSGAAQVTTITEGKIMGKILFSSFVDNFEVFLGDLLYEISLAKPETMKSNQTITVEEVLNCADIEEFVKFIAKKKISKFQKGSVKEFIKENPPIAGLNILTASVQTAIEKILQIRHLYTHRNGIIDEKFLLYFPESLTLGTEYLLSVDKMLDYLQYLVDIVQLLDHAAMLKFQMG